jgi:hypothetical protein
MGSGDGGRFEVRPYEPHDDGAWDALAARAPMASFLHTRRFLGYHGDRFEDASLVVTDRGRMIAVLPAAIDPDDPTRVVSHPGATFGGLVHDGSLTGERALAAMRAVAGAYAERGLSTLAYKPVPWIYHRVPSDDDVYTLFRLGAARARVELSCAIELSRRREPRPRRRRSRRKSLARGLELSEALELVPEFWRVLERNLALRHDAAPVHTVEEILRIHHLFPKHVRFVIGTLDGIVVAGTVLFTTEPVAHTQYTACDERGREICALDGVREHCVDDAAQRGHRFLDFGISTENGGSALNAGLYTFKREFGGGGVRYETYEHSLRC